MRSATANRLKKLETQVAEQQRPQHFGHALIDKVIQSGETVAMSLYRMTINELETLERCYSITHDSYKPRLERMSILREAIIEKTAAAIPPEKVRQICKEFLAESDYETFLSTLNEFELEAMSNEFDNNEEYQRHPIFSQMTDEELIELIDDSTTRERHDAIINKYVTPQEGTTP